MGITTIPLEMVQEITSHLHNDIPTLGRTLWISEEFRTVARSLIFSKVVLVEDCNSASCLTYRQQCKLFDGVLAISPHIAKLVRELHIVERRGNICVGRIGFLDNEYWVAKEQKRLTRILRQLRWVETFKIGIGGDCGGSATRWDTFPTRLRQSIKATLALPTLQHLLVERLYCIPNDFFDATRSLESLSLIDVTFKPEPTPMVSRTWHALFSLRKRRLTQGTGSSARSPPCLPRQLHSLKISCHPPFLESFPFEPNHSWHCLCNYGFSPNIQPYQLPHKRQLVESLANSGSSVQILELVLLGCICRSFPHESPIDFSRLPELRILRVLIDYVTPGRLSSVKAMTNVLEAIRFGRVLDEIFLSFVYQPRSWSHIRNPCKDDWAGLDKCLGKTQYKGLRKITIGFVWDLPSWTDEEEKKLVDLVSQMLPRFWARGLVNVVCRVFAPGELPR